MVTLKDISRLQKRARDKEYKLRKRGAYEERVADASPRLPFAQVKKMNTRELTAYAKQLENFNKRGNAYTIVNGTPVHTEYIKAAETARQSRNARIQKERKRVENFYQSQPVRFSHPANPISNEWAALELWEPYNLPASDRLARERAARTEKAAKRSYTSYRESNRRSFVGMLLQMGELDLAAMVEDMTPAKFDAMAMNSNLWDELQFLYDPEGQERTRRQMGATQYDAHMEGVRQTINEAETLGYKTKRGAFNHLSKVGERLRSQDLNKRFAAEEWNTRKYHRMSANNAARKYAR